MFRRSRALVVAAALVAGVAVTGSNLASPTVAQAQTAPAPALSAPVSGVFDGGTFEGTFVPQSFSVVGGVLQVTGQLVGTLTTTLTGIGQPVSSEATFPITVPTSTLATNAPIGTCSVLNLLLAPLDLNLLGLTVHLDQVHLIINAVAGSGSLLGNLLCAVTHLLDGAGFLEIVSQLLNSILGILGGITPPTP